MSEEYREGDWFAVPLRRGGYVVGLVARRPQRGSVILGYFFGPERKAVPAMQELTGIRAGDAQLVCRVKDTALHRGVWRVLGRRDRWRRKDWPMPAFHRREALSGRGIRIEYDGDSLTTPVREVPASVPDASLPDDVVLDETRLLEALARILAQERPVTLDQSQWIR